MSPETRGTPYFASRRLSDAVELCLQFSVNAERIKPRNESDKTVSVGTGYRTGGAQEIELTKGTLADRFHIVMLFPRLSKASSYFSSAMDFYKTCAFLAVFS